MGARKERSQEIKQRQPGTTALEVVLSEAPGLDTRNQRGQLDEKESINNLLQTGVTVRRAGQKGAAAAVLCADYITCG